MSRENVEDFNDICFTFKLVSGDTIVCYVLQDTDNNVIVMDPVQINTHAVLVNGVIKGMSYYSNWFTGAENRVHMIRKDHILSAALPDEILLSEYSEMVRRKISPEEKPAPVPTKKQWSDINFKINPKNRFDLN